MAVEARPVPFAAVILRNADGRLVWGRRHADAALGGYWEMSGGKIENGEQAEDTARREIHEELGVEIDDLEYFETIAHDSGGVWYVTTVYTGRCGDLPAADRRETQEVALLDPRSRPDPVTPYSLDLWRRWLEHISQWPATAGRR